MKNFQQIFELICEIEKIDKKTEVAKVLGIRQQNLTTLFNNNNLPYKHLHKYCQERNISLDWFFNDVGKQNIDTIKTEMKYLLGENERLKDTVGAFTRLSNEHEKRIQQLEDNQVTKEELEKKLKELS